MIICDQSIPQFASDLRSPEIPKFPTMNPSRRQFLKLNLLDPAPSPPAATDPDLHLLNRITWGARPEELARVRQMERDAYLEEQLDPESIDDSEMEQLMGRFKLLTLDRRTLFGLNNYWGRVSEALVESMIQRAVYSKRQLLERMVEFWADHFNVPLDEPGDSVLYQRDAIRKHALGNFHNMLMATAKAPAMLVYLNNDVNIAEHPNENYARELFELHTLGVDGGHYSEEDIREAARSFTGWTTHPRTRSGFYFDEENHDTNAKQVLGHNLPAGRGIEDGLHVLSLAAHHPATSQFLSYKLCRRFVSDDPPQSLVNSTAQVWRQHKGEIVPVLRHLFTSAGFYASAGQKLRRPLDFFIGALRATDTCYNNRWAMYEMLEEMGQTPYGWNPPDGYPDTADAWISTGGMLARWNAAMLLTHGVHSDPETWGWTSHLHQRIPAPDQPGGPSTVGELVDAVATQVFGAPLSDATRSHFVRYASSFGPDYALSTRQFAKKMPSLFGLMLASPLYQWR